MKKTNIKVKLNKLTEKVTDKKILGQYFTISNDLQHTVFNLVKNKDYLTLEPSFGAGHLLINFLEYNTNYPMVCCEIDKTIKPIVTFNSNQQIIYGDFLKLDLDQKFKTIIGNPPYVKNKTGNLFIKFIEKCYNYLDDNGELIFIVPSEFLKLTSACKIIENMKNNGSFTNFFFPNNEGLFENACVDIVIFRYEKNLFTNKTLVNNEEKFCNINSGIITFSDNEVNGIKLEDLFNVYVGIVSGKDEIYKVPFGNIEVLDDKDRVEKYIFTNEFPTNNIQIDNHLLSNKSKLLERRIKKFNETNWFEWGAPRNITSIKKFWDKKCIYIRTMTRKKDIAFLGKVQYFGGGLLCLVPKNDLTDIELNKIIDYLNSIEFQKNYIYSGRFKIGHKQLSLANIPNLT
jgi:adenine-specific DNA-methyltransferase